MTQPKDCLEWTIDPEPPAPLPSRDLAAVYMVIAVVVVIAIFEVWALTHGHNTISQMIQKVMRGHTILQILGAIGIGFLGWHLIRGGPW
jgi:hypothetical protein